MRDGGCSLGWVPSQSSPTRGQRNLLEIFDDLDLPLGQAVEEAHRRAEAFVARYQRSYQAALRCCLTPCPS